MKTFLAIIAGCALLIVGYLVADWKYLGFGPVSTDAVKTCAANRYEPAEPGDPDVKAGTIVGGEFSPSDSTRFDDMSEAKDYCWKQWQNGRLSPRGGLG